GLKSGVGHSVRVNCGGAETPLYLENGSQVKELSADNGEVVNLIVKNKNCEPPPVTPTVADETDYKGKMRLIAKGQFLMGDDQGEPNERPAHVVSLDDYYIDKFEVTNQQYREFSSSPRGRPFPGEPSWDPSYSSKLDHPVAGVAW